ncbi:MAG TPA: hypothetical protein VFI24_27185 [Pyrinomonadaceae bacterium]|nr:hypothetical protein [Pyrinomonadaceae bacterium]
MEKGIVRDIISSNVVHREDDDVVIEVPVANVQVHVSESTVVDGDVDPHVVVNDGVNDSQVQGEIR